MLMDAESQPSPPKRMRTLSESSSSRVTDVSDIQVTSDYTVQSVSGDTQPWSHASVAALVAEDKSCGRDMRRRLVG